MKRSKNILLLAVLLSTLCWAAYELSKSSHDKALEVQTQAALASAIAGDKLYASSSDLGIDRFSRLCLQRPYMTEKAFREASGLQALNYSFIGDDAYVWWLVDGAGREQWIRVPTGRLAGLDDSVRQPCFTVASLHFKLSKRSFNTETFWTYSPQEK